jgi:hypothetical protein
MEPSGLDVWLLVHRSLHAAPPSGGNTFFQNMSAGLTDAHYRQGPAGHTSIAFLLWHIARWEDAVVNVALHAAPEVLDRDGWLGRLGVDTREAGVGWTPAQVDAFSQRVDVDALLAYWEAVGQQTRASLRPADLADLYEGSTAEAERMYASGVLSPDTYPWLPRRPRRWFLDYGLLGHPFVHLGEVDHQRRLLGLPGA